MEKASGYESLTEHQKEIYNEYASKRKPCPQCNKTDNVLVIVIGRPSDDLNEVKRKTNIVKLKGCMQDDYKKFECNACQVKYD